MPFRPIDSPRRWPLVLAAALASLLAWGCHGCDIPSERPPGPAELVLPAWNGPSEATRANWRALDQEAAQMAFPEELQSLWHISRTALIGEVLSYPPSRDAQGEISAERATREYSRALEAWTREQGPERFRLLGAVVWPEFSSALNAGVAAARADGRPVLEWLAENPEHPAAEHMVRWTGDYFLAAERFGVRNEDGRMLAPDGTERLLFEEFWKSQLARTRGIDLSLPTAVRGDLLRFRLLHVEGAPIERQTRWLEELYDEHDGLGDRPIGQVRIALMVRTGHLREARMAIGETATLSEDRKAVLMDWVDRVAAGTTGR